MHSDDGESLPRTGFFPPRLTLSFGFLLVAAALPVLFVKIPFLTDYPNHLARLFILAWGDQDRFLSTYYSVSWPIIPNLAVDMIVPPLARISGIYAAGKLFVLLIAVLTVSGTAALHFAVHRRPSAWPLVSFLFLYNY